MLGGAVRTNRHAMIDETTRAELQPMAIDVLFMSCDGLRSRTGSPRPTAKST